jgi:hypothetical protein
VLFAHLRKFGDYWHPFWPALRARGGLGVQQQDGLNMKRLTS